MTSLRFHRNRLVAPEAPDIIMCNYDCASFKLVSSRFLMRTVQFHGGARASKAQGKVPVYCCPLGTL